MWFQKKKKKIEPLGVCCIVSPQNGGKCPSRPPSVSHLLFGLIPVMASDTLFDGIFARSSPTLTHAACHKAGGGHPL